MTYNNLAELGNNTLQEDDKVVIAGIIHEVNTTFLNVSGRSNYEIFEKLFLDKKQFCTEHYGYESGRGDWPLAKARDFAALETQPIPLRDYFAGQAMQTIMSETQEMRVASFWDWIKYLLITYLHFNFLHVNMTKSHKDVYLDAAKRAYEFADALIIARKQN